MNAGLSTGNRERRYLVSHSIGDASHPSEGRICGHWSGEEAGEAFSKQKRQKCGSSKTKGEANESRWAVEARCE